VPTALVAGTMNQSPGSHRNGTASGHVVPKSQAPAGSRKKQLQ
jgi:hypothetical protein